jgi:hypothetical protein
MYILNFPYFPSQVSVKSEKIWLIVAAITKDRDTKKKSLLDNTS